MALHQDYTEDVPFLEIRLHILSLIVKVSADLSQKAPLWRFKPSSSILSKNTCKKKKSGLHSMRFKKIYLSNILKYISVLEEKYCTLHKNSEPVNKALRNQLKKEKSKFSTALLQHRNIYILYIHYSIYRNIYIIYIQT